MADKGNIDTVVFTRDMTLRWPCRQGDFLLWLRYGNLLAGDEGVQCDDLWEMRDGDHVTITNRLEDLPVSFRLHPTEVRNSFVYRLIEQFERGDYPSEPIDGPNLWRLQAGDRLAWVGAHRPDRHSVDGLLEILDFRDCALAIGEGRVELQEPASFGSPTTSDMSPADVARCRVAVAAARRLGPPRTWDSEWSLG